MATGKITAPTLADVRRQIDEVDDRMHDLLMRRAELVERVAGLKRSDDVAPFRPGREAQILRRLIGRHRGRFPRPALVRLWREIMGGTVAMQTQLSAAVQGGCWDIARDHFGSHAPLLSVRSAGDVLAAVAEGRAVVGVLPLDDETVAHPWWLRLAATGEPRPRVIARLPFGTVGNAVAACSEAVVIAAMAPDESGDDCTLVVVSAPRALDSAKLTDALRAERIDSNPIAARERDNAASYLIELEALVALGDARLARGLRVLGDGVTAAWLGCYARPLPDAALDGVAPE